MVWQESPRYHGIVLTDVQDTDGQGRTSIIQWATAGSRSLADLFEPHNQVRESRLS